MADTIRLLVESVDARALPDAPPLAAAALEKRTRRAVSACRTRFQWLPPGCFGGGGEAVKELEKLVLGPEGGGECVSVVGVEWGVHSVAHDVQAVVKGVPERLEGLGVCGLMCRFGSEGHCWFVRDGETGSWMLSDPSSPGEAARWAGLCWGDVQRKCTGVFKTREKTLGTFKPTLFVFSHAPPPPDDATTINDTSIVSVADEESESESEGGGGMVERVHSMLERVQAQLEEDDEGGVLVGDMLETIVSLQDAHRREIADMERERERAGKKAGEDAIRLTAALERVALLESDLRIWNGEVGEAEALPLPELTELVGRAERTGGLLRSVLTRKLQALEQEVEMSRACVVCVTERKCALFLPCRHLCACVECARNLSSCPLCRGEIDETIVCFNS